MSRTFIYIIDVVVGVALKEKHGEPYEKPDEFLFQIGLEKLNWYSFLEYMILTNIFNLNWHMWELDALIKDRYQILIDRIEIIFSAQFGG